jgi:hypothetical protein
VTITFANDNNIILYPYVLIISYTRDNEYIFLAQTIWWTASIIGLQQGLVMHIDNLRKRSEAMVRGAAPQAQDTINQCDNSQQGEEKSATPYNIRGDSRLHNELGHIHPDRISQAQSTIHNISDLQLSNSLIDQSSQIIKQAELIIQKFQKDQKWLTNWKDPMSRTRSWQILAKPLFKNQRNYLQSIPQAMISHY